MRTVSLLWILALGSAGCSFSESPEIISYRELTSGKIGEIDEKLLQWSSARKRNEQVLEEMLRRDLRREAGRSIDGLKMALSSGEPAIRATAAAAIGFTEDVGSVALLAALLKDPDSSVRANALLGLCLIRSRTTPLGEVLARFEDPDALVRRMAVKCAADVVEPGPADPAVYEALLGAMKDADPGVRVNATSALAGIGDPRCAPALAKAGLADENDNVRRNAAIGLGRLKVPATAGHLVNAMRREMNEHVRRAMAAALRRVTGKDFGEDADAWERHLAEAGGTGADNSK